MIGWVVFSSMSTHRLAQARANSTACSGADRARRHGKGAATPTRRLPTASCAAAERVRLRPGAGGALLAPAMVVDMPDTSASGLAGAEPAAPAAGPGRRRRLSAQTAAAGAQKPSADEAFANRLKALAPRPHTPLACPTPSSWAGTVIPAVLETAINSDLPGFVRAVARDVRGFDGSTVLKYLGAQS